MSRRKFLRMKEYLQDADEDDSERFKVFTLEFVIKKVIDYAEDKTDQRVREIAKWKIKSTENVLKALLKNNKDEIAW